MLEEMTDDNLCFNLNEDMTDEEKIQRLIELTRDNKDNHSAYLIHILGDNPIVQNKRRKSFFSFLFGGS